MQESNESLLFQLVSEVKNLRGKVEGFQRTGLPEYTFIETPFDASSETATHYFSVPIDSSKFGRVLGYHNGTGATLTQFECKCAGMWLPINSAGSNLKAFIVNSPGTPIRLKLPKADGATICGFIGFRAEASRL